MRQHALAFNVGLLFVGFGSLLAAGDAKDEAIKKERKKFEGTWQVVSLVVDGDKSDEQDARKITVVNEADGRWTLEVDGKVIARGTSEIDPTKKPKAIDLTETEGDDKGKTALGIYDVDGDTWKHCFSFDKRPEKFESKEGSKATNAVLKRVKK